MGAGRPTKYKEKKTIRAVEKFIQEMNLKNFFESCGIEHVALLLGVCRDTIYEWAKIYPEFSDTIKKWETKRNALFYVLSMKMGTGAWIFLAKNWLGMRDEQMHVFDEEHPLRIIFREEKNADTDK